MQHLGTLLAVVGLLIANAFFVAAEFALVKARGLRIEQLARNGDRLASRVSHIQDRLEPYLAACQLGITMASLGLGWVGEPAVAALIEPTLMALGLGEHVHTIAFALGFLVFSSLHIVIGEQVPKTLALRESIIVSRLCALPLQAFYVLCFPLNWLLNWSSRRLLSVMGVREAEAEEILSSDELSSLVDHSEHHGALPARQADLLRNVFQFDERPVASIMVPRREIEHLDISADPAETERVVRRTQHSRLPLIDGKWENTLGFVLVRDLFGAVLDHGAGAFGDLARHVREPLVVPESQPVARLFDAMRDARAHLAFVTDEYGELVGIVSLEDLLEEIVGDIEDEFDEAGPIAIHLCEEGWEAHGLVPLADLQRTIGLPEPGHLGVNTLSGLVMQHLQRLPVVGDVVEVGSFTVRVDAIQNRRVERATVLLSPEPATSKED